MYFLKYISKYTIQQKNMYRVLMLTVFTQHNTSRRILSVLSRKYISSHGVGSCKRNAEIHVFYALTEHIQTIAHRNIFKSWEKQSRKVTFDHLDLPVCT